MFNHPQSLHTRQAINIVNEPVGGKDGLALELQLLPPKYEKYRERLRLGASQELHSEPISSDKAGPLFKGELILNIDVELGIYTLGLGAPSL